MMAWPYVVLILRTGFLFLASALNIIKNVVSQQELYLLILPFRVVERILNWVLLADKLITSFSQTLS